MFSTWFCQSKGIFVSVNHGLATTTHNLWFCSSVVATKVNKTTHTLHSTSVKEMQLCINLRTTLLLYTASSLFSCSWLTERPCLTQPTHLPCMAQAWGGERSFLQTKYQWSQTSWSVFGTAWRTSMTCYLKERLLLLSSDRTCLTALSICSRMLIVIVSLDPNEQCRLVHLEKKRKMLRSRLKTN